MRIAGKSLLGALAVGLVLLVSNPALPEGVRSEPVRRDGKKIESSSDIGTITITRTGVLSRKNAFAAHVSQANKTVIESRRDQRGQAAFHKAVSVLLMENKLATAGGGVRLVIRPTGCAVNHRGLPEEISKEIHRIWKETGRPEIQIGDTVIMEFTIKDETHPAAEGERNETPADLRIGFEPSPDQIHQLETA